MWFDLSRRSDIPALPIPRRELIGAGAAALLTGLRGLEAAVKERPRIAALVTEYRPHSHAEVIVGKFLDGCKVLDFEFKPQVEVVSLYLDQIPADDTGRDAAAAHAVPIYSSIRGALTRGTGKLAVDGVLIIGEHGRYPYNALGQQLYPRRRFFEETAGVMRESGRAIPVFNDKHLGLSWTDAKWIVDTARELNIPLMSGSSVPVSWRRPDLQLRVESPLTGALMVGYGGTESYGFHALEGLQCMVERRKGGETGVRRVQWVTGESVWAAAQQGYWSWDLLCAALSRSERPAVRKISSREAIRQAAHEAEGFLIDYRDGFRAAVLMLIPLADEFLFAGRLEGMSEPISTLFWLQPEPPYGHFARLCGKIQRMFLTGKAMQPVERTLLTTGVLDQIMHSRYEKGSRRATPELDVRYAMRDGGPLG